jgi:hypothetical protein
MAGRSSDKNLPWSRLRNSFAPRMAATEAIPTKGRPPGKEMHQKSIFCTKQRRKWTWAEWAQKRLSNMQSVPD